MYGAGMTVAQASEEASRLGITLEVLLKVAFASITHDLIRLHAKGESGI